MALLETKDLTKHFGGVAAVDSVNLHVDKGEILGLIGPNGAGKTTLFNLIAGVLAPTGGKIIYKGENITGRKSHTIAKKGLIRTWQETNLFKEMTVFENMLLGHHLHQKVSRIGSFFSSRFSRDEGMEIAQRSMDALKYWELIDVKDEQAKNLPHGLQRALALLMAVAGDPELLLLDEPVTGMNQEEIDSMGNLIKSIRDRGITIMVVEHNMRTVMGITDRIFVLSFGKKIAEGTPQEIQNNNDVIDAYLGVGVEV